MSHCSKCPKSIIRLKGNYFLKDPEVRLFFKYSNRVSDEIGQYFQGLQLRGLFDEKRSNTKRIRKYYDLENTGILQLGTFWQSWQREYALIQERINENIVNFAQESKGILTLESVNQMSARSYYELLAVFCEKKKNTPSNAGNSPVRNI